MNLLRELSAAAVERTETTFLRYMDALFPWENRMTALIGPRGVGKTTLLLQHIKRHLSLADSLYVSAESIYFSNHTLFDTALQFNKMGGHHLFIDEVHKYKGWSTELKMIYDNLSDLQVIFTGSSVLDIYKGTADLSRRALVFEMQGMSFREYLNMSLGLSLPIYSMEQIIANEVKLPREVKHPLALFMNYLQKGYYPFYAQQGYELRLNQIVNMTLESDIPIYANYTVSVSKKLKQLMQIIADSVPFKPNYSSLAEMVKADRNNLSDYFYLMERAGLIAQLHEPTQGVRALGKVEKIYLDNTNLSYALSVNKPETGNLRETFFYNQMRVNHLVTNSSISDFQIDGRIFEVGGKNKGQKQIASATEGYIVKDGIEHGYGNVIPLWAFGFNY